MTREASRERPNSAARSPSPESTGAKETTGAKEVAAAKETTGAKEASDLHRSSAGPRPAGEGNVNHQVDIGLKTARLLAGTRPKP